MFIVQLLLHGNPKVLGFAALAQEAETMLEGAAVQYIREDGGRARSDAAFDEPSGEGLYLKRYNASLIELWCKQLKSEPDGWVFSGSIGLGATRVGVFRTDQFELDLLHPNSTLKFQDDSHRAPKRRNNDREQPKKPYLNEMQTHPLYQIKTLGQA